MCKHCWFCLFIVAWHDIFSVSVYHLPCYLTEDEEGEQMDYLGGDAALKHHKQMAKFRQASCLSPTGMSSTSRPVRIYTSTQPTVVVLRVSKHLLYPQVYVCNLKSKSNRSIFGHHLDSQYFTQNTI